MEYNDLVQAIQTELEQMGKVAAVPTETAHSSDLPDAAIEQHFTLTRLLMKFEEKLARLARISKDRTDQLERNKNLWIQKVNDLYKEIGNWFSEYVQKGYVSVDHDRLQIAECEEFLMHTRVMQLNLGGDQGPSVIFEPTGINIAGAFGKMDLHYRGHKDEGVFLLLIRDDDGKFRWEIWKSRKQREDVTKFDKETFEGLLDRWLEKWAGFEGNA